MHYFLSFSEIHPLWGYAQHLYKVVAAWAIHSSSKKPLSISIGGDHRQSIHSFIAEKRKQLSRAPRRRNSNVKDGSDVNGRANRNRARNKQPHSNTCASSGRSGWGLWRLRERFRSQQQISRDLLSHSFPHHSKCTHSTWAGKWPVASRCAHYNVSI